MNPDNANNKINGARRLFAGALREEKYVDVYASSNSKIKVDNISVRIGVHPDYQRMVFDWNVPVTYELDYTKDLLSLVFNQPAQVKINQKSLARAKFFSNPNYDNKNNRLNFKVNIPLQSSVRDFKVNNKVVIDVLAGGSTVQEPKTSVKEKVNAEALPAKADLPAGMLPSELPSSKQSKTNTDIQVKPVNQDKVGLLVQKESPSVGPKDVSKNAEETPVRTYDEVDNQNAYVTQNVTEEDRFAAQMEQSFRVDERISLTLDEFTVEMKKTADGVSILFDWKEEVSAAVFPRGGYYWVVFDKQGRSAFSPVNKEIAQLVPFSEQVAANNGTVLRFLIANKLQPSISQNGTVWEVQFTKGGSKNAANIPVTSEPMANIPRLHFLVNVDAISDRVEFLDPEIGDYVQVIQ